MTDMEYTVLKIRDAAKNIVRLTDHPEVGLFTYLSALGAEMTEIEKCKKVQPCHPNFINIDLEDAISGNIQPI